MNGISNAVSVRGILCSLNYHFNDAIDMPNAFQAGSFLVRTATQTPQKYLLGYIWEDIFICS
jgi:hypothetical protein